MNEKLFRKSSIDRVNSPEQLDDYIRVTGPSLWVVLLAVVILLAAALVWGVFGAHPTRLSVMGYAQNGAVTCFLTPEDAEKVQNGMDAQVGKAEGRVVTVGDIPLSPQEIAELLGNDYLAGALGAGTWSVPVEISAPDAPDGVAETRITVERVRPIQFILN